MDLGTSKGKVMPGNCLIKNVENLGRVGYTCEIQHFSFHGLNYRTGEWNFSWRPFLCASGLWTEPDLRTLNINYQQWRKQVKSNFKHSQGALAPLEQGRQRDQDAAASAGSGVPQLHVPMLSWGPGGQGGHAAPWVTAAPSPEHGSPAALHRKLLLVPVQRQESSVSNSPVCFENFW